MGIVGCIATVTVALMSMFTSLLPIENQNHLSINQSISEYEEVPKSLPLETLNHHSPLVHLQIDLASVAMSLTSLVCLAQHIRLLYL